MMEEIMELDVSREAKMRKMKEYWCLFGKAVRGSEERKRRVLHADRLEEVLALILEMTKQTAAPIPSPSSAPQRMSAG